MKWLEEDGMKTVGGGWDEVGWRRVGSRWLKEIRMKIVGGKWDEYGRGDGEEYSWRRMG